MINDDDLVEEEVDVRDEKAPLKNNFQIEKENENEFTSLFYLSVWQIIHDVAVQLRWIMSNAIIGKQFGTETLAGLALANLTANLLGFSLIYGSLSAMDTLAPQAFGKKDYKEIGIIAQRALFISACLAFFILSIFLNIKKLFQIFGQEGVVCDIASHVLAISTIFVPGICVTEILQRIAVCQGIVKPFAILAILLLVLHRFWLYLFIDLFGYDYIGAPFAQLCSHTLNLIGTLVYIVYSKQLHPEIWDAGWNWNKSINNRSAMKEYTKLSFAGLFGLSTWWFNECVSFLAGTLGVVSLATHSICDSAMSVLFMFPYGASTAVNVKIGNLLGEGRPEKAVKIGIISNIGACFMGLICAIISFILRDHIVGIFSEDEKVFEAAERIWIGFVIFLFFDNVQGIQKGILKGLGLQVKQSICLVIILWIISFPLAIILCRKTTLGLLSIWIVMPFSFALITFSFTLLQYFTSWENISNKICNNQQ